MSAVPQPVPTQAELEFDRQVDALATTGLPEHLELADSCFRAMLEPLRDVLPDTPPEADRIPFVVVVPVMPVTDVLTEVHGVGGTGFTTMGPDELARLAPLPELDVPRTPYLLLDVDTGADTLNRTPADVLPELADVGRSPLTVEEGVAVLVSDPGVLRSRNCFSLLGSRAGDERVPALWVSARRPRLAWASRRAPRRWLGAASCADRVTPGQGA